MKAKLPEAAQRTADQFPEVWDAYQALGKAAEAAGPLDAKTIRLIKLGISIGASFDSAARSHIRRALREDGVTGAELRHAALLAITTVGWSRGVATLDWIKKVESEG
ncbi:MAG TPA: carboxymuconolactone decarboxylase family protein [Hyphomicrobiaceae bacterium]|nr:carboxymuconolactone decarboxylase family protein [Hyphomicrobiaceae bacterium]